MTSKWTAEDIPGLTGKIAIVTGANSGIGYEMAQALARRQAMVILACRNKDKGAAAVRQIAQEHPDAKAELVQLDLSDLASVRLFADEFTSRYDRLDILINNAGIMRTPFGKTSDGFELQFGTNHLGHFALTGLLLDLIIRSPQARVITVSSGGHRRRRSSRLDGDQSFGSLADGPDAESIHWSEAKDGRTANAVCCYRARCARRRLLRSPWLAGVERVSNQGAV